jgi:hypothetical protein
MSMDIFCSVRVLFLNSAPVPTSPTPLLQGAPVRLLRPYLPDTHNSLFFSFHLHSPFSQFWFCGCGGAGGAYFTGCTVPLQIAIQKIKDYSLRYCVLALGLGYLQT